MLHAGDEPLDPRELPDPLEPPLDGPSEREVPPVPDDEERPPIRLPEHPEVPDEPPDPTDDLPGRQDPEIRKEEDPYDRERADP